MLDRRLLPFAALGCGAWLAFVITMFPAATALRWFAPESLRASNVEGTVWSGSAQLASAGDLALRDLAWDIDALPLLLGRLSGTAQAGLPSGFVNTNFSVSGDSVRLTALQLSTSLSLLAAVLPISGTSGQLSAQLESLTIEDQWPVSVAGTVRVSELMVEPLPGLGNQLLSLGSFEVEFVPSSDPASISAAIRDRGGPLALEANLLLTPAREYTIEGSISARASAPQNLVQGLDFMTGAPGPDGRRPLSLTGSL